MARQKLLVSFDFDNDATLKMLFVNQSKHPDAPFDIWDSSVKVDLTRFHGQFELIY
jgi:hypothetical protein